MAIYGQESNYTTWRLGKMNLAVRGIEADIKWNSEGSFHKDEMRELKPTIFWQTRRLAFLIGERTLARRCALALWRAAFGQCQLCVGTAYVHHLAPAGVADCMVALPGQLFYSTQIPVCLWFLARDKSNGIARNVKLCDRRGEVLFIAARKLGHMVDRTSKEFSEVDIAKIANTYHAWRGEGDAGVYEDEPGFCKSATLEEQFKEADQLTTDIRQKLAEFIADA